MLVREVMLNMTRTVFPWTAPEPAPATAEGACRCGYTLFLFGEEACAAAVNDAS